MKWLKIIFTMLFIVLCISDTFADVRWNTQTWLDGLIDIIQTDEGLKNRFDIKNEKKRVTQEDLDTASTAANKMNLLIIDAIKKTWVANDGTINTADARDLNDYIYKNYYEIWKQLHGDDEKDGSETWFHRVQNDGANTILYWENAINTVADGIYHLGFGPSKKNRLLNEDGNNNASFASVWYWISDLMQSDLATSKLKGPNYKTLEWSTDTWLDIVVDIIKKDAGLAERVSTTDMREAAKSADLMNHIIINAIKATGIANDGEINTADARELNDYIYKNYHDRWVELHGDDEKETWFETGYHRVQNDGAVTQLFWKNALNRVFDGIYHLGFASSKKNNLLNEDGNGNAKYSSVAFWLNDILEDDLKSGSLRNGAIVKIAGTTNTGLDEIIEYLITDVWLNQRVKTSDMIEWAKAADEMNKIIIQAMKATWVTNDGYISIADVRELNLYIVEKYAQEWALYHWDDEEGEEETGFHLVQNDGASKKMFGKNAVNQVFDGIYHLGFPTDNKNRLKNEDGKNNASFKSVAEWLDGLMWEDIRWNESIKWEGLTGLEVISWDWYKREVWYKWWNLDGVWIAILKWVDRKWFLKANINATNDWRSQNAFIVFDYISEKRFKFAWAKIWANYWTIGEVKDGKFKNKKILKEEINTNQNYNIEIWFRDKKVILLVDWKEKIRTEYDDSLNSTLWFAAQKATAKFENIEY